MAVGDGSGDGARAEIRGHDGFQGVEGFKRGERGRKYCAGLVACGTNGGFVFGENGAGNDGGKDFTFGFGLRQQLIADAGVLDLERDHFAQAEAHDGEGFSGLGGQGIEIEDEDADNGVGQDDSDGAGARRNFVEG